MIDVKFEELVGKIMKTVVNDKDERVIFTTEDDEEYMLYHGQNCCESVRVEDVCGDLADLVGFPVLHAEESIGKRPEDRPAPEWGIDSETWTFYRISTVRGTVVIRWHGESNGWYSEGVDFVRTR